MTQNNVGIYASQISGHLYDGPYGAYDSLATVTLSASTATVTFAGIPSGYKHLQMRYVSNNTGAAYYILLQFNSDTGSNYASHQLTGNGTSASASGGASTTSIAIPRNSGTFNTQIMSVGVVDVLDYANTSKYKTLRSLGGYDTNDNGQAVDFNSGVWMSTIAVNSITLSAIAGNFNTNSKFALYGVK